MLVKTFGSTLLGVDAITITIEVNIDRGVNFLLVGLPDSAVRESQQRIEAALKNNGFKLPGKKIVINLAPASIRKEGSAYDLTLAVGILAASDQIKPKMSVSDFIMMGELSLDGTVKPIKGALPIAIQARKEGFKGLILPEVNAREAAIVDDLDVYGVENLMDVIRIFEGSSDSKPIRINTRETFFNSLESYEFDFSDVKGQENIKRALEIAAAGGHNVILVGPPGAGKTMLAKRLPSILPPLNLHEALETTKIHSVAGKVRRKGLITVRPFRSPHHTISDVALVGGGQWPQPGEISMAHNGVLFLDELPEFKRTVLEVMRQPMEERKVTISRAKFSVDYPASFMLIASMNPCPCGFYNHPEKECVCGPGVVQKYLNKISGPLLDRIDIHIEVTPVAYKELSDTHKSESSHIVRERVIKARDIQQNRFDNANGMHCNAQMASKQIEKHCALDTASAQILKNAMEKLGLSARAYDRILKVARTIADLEKSERIQSHHMAEAIHFRSLDRDSWAG